MTFSGKYEGTLWYGAGYSFSSSVRPAALTFRMDLEETDNYFTGIAFDVEGMGYSPDEAKVEGIINGIHIEFYKVYRRRHYSSGRGNIIFRDEEGFPIYYVGTYNDDTGFYEGTWKYDVVGRFLFFFKKPIALGSGTFQMKKVES